MVSKSTLASVTGGAIVAASILFYAYGTLLDGARELAVNGTALIAVAAFFAVLAYEDWRDAQRNTRPRRNSRSRS